MAEFSDLRIHLHASTVKGAEGLESDLRARGATIASSSSGQILDALELLGRSSADVMLVDSPDRFATEVDLLPQVLARFPKLEIVMRAPELTVESLRDGVRAGAREVVGVNSGLSELMAALGRIADRHQSSRAYSGRLLAFISCKGGSGATFTAANLAYTLAESMGKRVLLIDLNLQFGDAVLYLSDRRPAASVVDMLSDSRRLDTALLQSALVPVLPNFGVLPAPVDPAATVEFGPDAVQQLMHFARTQADYVIVDLGRALDATSIQVLDMADQVYPVLQQTLPYIRDGKRMIDVFRSLGYPAEKIRPVLSRYQSQSEISEGDLEDALGMKIFVSIPNEYKTASSSVNQGVPVWKLSRNSVISRGFSEFVSRLESVTVSVEPWFKRILRRA